MTPGDPAYTNAWGSVLGESYTILDAAISGITALSVAGASNVVLTTTPGSTAQDPVAHFVFTGALTGSIIVLWPNGKTRKFSVTNNTTGAYSLSLGVSNGSGGAVGTTVAIAQGTTGEFVSDGTNVILVANAASSSQGAGINWAVAGGAADAITATYTPVNASLTDGLLLAVRMLDANATTTPTFAPDSLTAEVITMEGGAAVQVGQWQPLQECVLRYNLADTRWELTNPAFVGGTVPNLITMSGAAINMTKATLASASTVNIGAANANYIVLTGTTTVNAFDSVQAGTMRRIETPGSLQFTNSSALVCPGGANITTQAGDIYDVVSEGSGNWRIGPYALASGAAIVIPVTGVSAGSYTNTNLTVGADGRLSAASSGPTGILTSFANKFRNGTMDVWQRGTGSMTATTGGAYTADGWIVVPTGASVAVAQAAGRGAGTGLVPNSLQITGAASVTDVTVKQRIESSMVAQLAGQTVTIMAQIYNNSGGSITPKLTLKYPSFTPDSYSNLSNSWSTASAVAGSPFTLQACAAGGVWTQVCYTVTLPNAVANGLEVVFDFGFSSFTSGTVRITELDIRGTSLPTGLTTPGYAPEMRPVDVELARCKRYLPGFQGAYGYLGANNSGCGCVGYTGNWGYQFTVPTRAPVTGVSYGATSISPNFSSGSPYAVDLTLTGSASPYGNITGSGAGSFMVFTGAEL